MAPKKNMKIVTKDEMEKKRKEKENIRRQKVQKEIKQSSEEYISQLSDFEKKVLEIAISQLESSFCLEKSIGFLEWSKSCSQAKE